MKSVTVISAILALIGSGIVGGVFFAFSSFVMKALGRLPSSEGIAAMQSINVVVINPSFLGAFMGSALLSVAVVVLVLQNDSSAAAPFFIGGAMSYFLGTFLVTLFGNVPMNDKLAASSATNPAAIKYWDHYLDHWSMLNHIRTVAALAAVLMYTAGLLQIGGT